MFPPFNVIFLIIMLTEIIIGMFGNGFIAVMYCINWVKMRKISSCDMILTCLGMSRILLQGTFAANLLINIFVSQIFIFHKVQITIGFLGLFARTADLWFVTCLSIFYCMKIINYNQPLFLRMKQRIPTIVPKLLLSSLVVSLVSSLPYIWGKYNFYFCISARDLLRNGTERDTSWDASYLYFILLYRAASFIPFVIFFTTSTLLIASLWRHTMNMKQNANCFWDPRTEAHVRAFKALISCLVLYVCNFVALTMLSLPSCLTDRTWTPLVSSMFITAYPSGHSLILILINPKLKQALVRSLHSIKCHLKEETF